jgi:stage II sporulation protein D
VTVRLLLWSLVIAAGATTTYVSAWWGGSQAPAGVAWFVRGLEDTRQRQEARADILDSPVLPGSVIKAASLVAALEAGIIQPDSARMCRRVVTVDGRKYVCSHPDLKRPLTPAEALAHSCNDFFLSLAPRLTREAFNAVRRAAGVPPIASDTPLAAALVGLDGPRITPRAMIDMLARLAGAGRDTPVPMKPGTRRVLLEGLRGAAEYGTAEALESGGISAIAKTGTAPMPGGGAMGIVVALTPADKPSRGIVVVAPGAAGLDAAAIAADLLQAPASAKATARQAPASAEATAGQAPVAKATARQAPASAKATAGQAPASAKAAAGQGPGAMGQQSIRLGRTLANGRTRIETLRVDDYIAQVLAGEGQPRAGDAAQQALAITARTFALANRNRHRQEGFDLCDTTHCQVLRPATETTTRASAATSGRVLLFQGQPAFVFYSAWCGGHTELASELWPGSTNYGGNTVLEDDACRGEPPWTSEVRVADLERALRAAGLRGRLKDLRVLQRNRSGRVARLRVDGFSPPELSGHELRMAVGRVAGWQLVKSTSFDVHRTGTGYRFEGRGFGHGVGLCVIGAGHRAAKGATADDILGFYFPGLSIGLIPTSSAPATPGPAAPATSGTPGTRGTPGTPGTPDITLALPGGEESERAPLVALLRRSRDELAKTTGVAAPARIRVTVHPTVESFGRATGQPWWVSGATEGADIDLLPLAILRQRGQLERTLRHELVHVLLESSLAGRPMWVREGAALYFSSPAKGGEAAPRTQCPTDAELLRAVSAGAQRDAYARAEACFARAIASGKKWNEVK